MSTFLQPNSRTASDVLDQVVLARVSADLPNGTTGVALELPIVDGSTNYLTQEEFETTVNAAWLIIMAIFVFILQAGFAMLEVGTVRAKNTKNILIKNVIDACLGVLIWWAFGFAFAYGTEGSNPNAFIGGQQFFLVNYQPAFSNSSPYLYVPTPNSYAFWFFQWTFAATTATIVSGAVAERCRFVGYLVYTFFLTGFIYPVVVHWVWSSQGWLSAFFNEDLTPNQTNLYKGMIDFAGSGVVHTTGGMAAFWGAFFLGPRIGRFDADGNVMELPGHSASLAALGVLILWFGFYGFNPGSTLGIWFSGTSGQNFAIVAGKVAVMTSISAGAGGMSTLLLHVLLGGLVDLAPIMNGVLAGLVGICASCVTIEPWAAFTIGATAGWVYYGCSVALKKLQIDDPLDAAPVHAGAGIWGVLMAGLFSSKMNTTATYGKNMCGAFYGPSCNGGDIFVTNLIGIITIVAWSSFWSIIMFGILKMAGLFRVPADEELAGMDASHHGGSAYEWQHDSEKAEKVEEKTEEPPAP